MAQVMLSIIAVNYNSSSLLKECFSSIGSAIGTADFEFIAVDSGSHETDVAHLLTLQGDGVEILLNKENIGYAKAVNQGLIKARGDFILITNPDVLYGPGSIQRMMKSFSELPQCGAVGPKTWWNRQMTFQLPMSEIITPWRNAKADFVRGSKLLRTIVLKNWIRRNLRYWQMGNPIEQEMLSGASIMTTKKVINAVGGFDGEFPLYFEDADWCLRTAKAGYKLYMDPGAGIIHYYNQSAKQETGTAAEKFDYSLGKFLTKHYKVQSALMNRIRQLRRNIKDRTSMPFDEMGTLELPPDFRFSTLSRKLLLLSPIDSLIPSAGAFFEGNAFRIPDDLWSYLGVGRYFVKVFELDGLRGCGSWTWVRSNS
jgi:GT2 family glycosyltransferase